MCEETRQGATLEVNRSPISPYISHQGAQRGGLSSSIPPQNHGNFVLMGGKRHLFQDPKLTNVGAQP